MPQLFGTDYLLPLVVIVALLIALLLLLAIRRRSAAVQEARISTKENAAATAAATGTAVPERAVPEATPPETRLLDTALPESAAVSRPVAQEERPAAGPSRLPAPGSALTADRAMQPAVDPLAWVLQDLLGGWGELTQEEARRLEIFRPERVIAAIAALELPKGKASEDARTRLTQLRQFAAGLERRLRTPGAGAPVPGPEYQIEFGQPEPGRARAGQAEPARVEPGEAGPSAEMPQTAAPLPGERTLDIPRSAGPERFWFGPAEEPFATVGPGPSPQPTEKMAVGAGGESPQPEPGLAAGIEWEEHKGRTELESFWADADTVWEQIPAEPVFEISEEPTAELFTETLPTAEPETVEPETTRPETMEQPAVPEPAAEQPAEAGGEGRSDAFARMGIRVRTAAELLSLPPQEQVEMIAFLEPWEVAAAFQASQSRELKLAAIDTLAHIASPAALSALGACLDDPDQEIQLYALETAERLLGKVDQL